MKTSLPLVATFLGSVALLSASLYGCGSAKDHSFDEDDGGGGGGSSGGLDEGGGGFGPSTDDASAEGGVELTRDPVTCEEAQESRSYVGCDYWPTVTGNNVFDIFDFAVVVSNTSPTAADVTVTGPSGTNQQVTVQSGTLEKIFLPWQPDLKGPNSPSSPSDPNFGAATPLPASVVAPGGAFHLVSSVPVVVYQFNPLEYKGQGGPSGKSWSSCPIAPGAAGCFSYSNDASLLLPSTAWTGNYRVTGVHGWSAFGQDVMGGYMVVTAAQADTNVTIALSPSGQILADNGSAVPATNGSGVVHLTLGAGDAVELVTPVGQAFDVSGSLVQADKPVQVITGIPCINVPSEQGACDHVEESVVPAEALGKSYVIAAPTSPNGGKGLHLVRFVGNRDGTTLTYTPSKPSGCPDSLSAGQVVECNGNVGTDFLVEGTNEFAVASFMVGSSVYDPFGLDPRGDPSETTFASTEQYRSSYLFLAPSDYDVSYAVVSGPQGAAPAIDGAALGGYTAVGKGFGIWRAKLGPGDNGVHKLTSGSAVGLQVMGYGSYTSYQYPGGLNLKGIAPPPVPVK